MKDLLISDRPQILYLNLASGQFFLTCLQLSTTVFIEIYTDTKRYVSKFATDLNHPGRISLTQGILKRKSSNLSAMSTVLISLLFALLRITVVAELPW